MRRRRELGKRSRSGRRIVLQLSRSSRSSLTCHAWKRGLKELPVNCVEEEQHGRTPLNIPGSIDCLLFQDVFFGTAKWFRGGCRSAQVSQPDVVRFVSGSIAAASSSLHQFSG